MYDVARNEDARKHREELEQKLAEEERIRKEKEMDYLAPFLARIGDPAILSRKEMEEVAEVRAYMYIGPEVPQCTCLYTTWGTFTFEVIVRLGGFHSDFLEKDPMLKYYCSSCSSLYCVYTCTV